MTRLGLDCEGVRNEADGWNGDVTYACEGGNDGILEKADAGGANRMKKQRILIAGIAAVAAIIAVVIGIRFFYRRQHGN